jgi:serine/threonine protein kinase
MRCHRCQFENSGESAYCSRCGSKLSPSSAGVETTFTQQYAPLRLDLEVGTVFAERYQVLEELGSGGMGKVYKVMDKELKEKIAIKILRPEISFDEKTIDRFRNELKLARKITHPNICRMYDLLKDKGLYYITMEYISGEDLKSTIMRVGQLSVGKTLAITRQICKGLAEAHKIGVVHRDLKPHNIIIDREGDVRIMDFGIAHSMRTQGLTESGVMIGTPEYMSPEQAVGEEADQRSDIYSLGIIMFELLTGTVPFKGDTAVGVALKHKTEPPPNPRTLNPEIPENVSRMILRCLEKERERRYQNIEDILEEIALALKGQPSTVKVLPQKPPTLTSQGRISKPRRSLTAFLISVLILAAGGGVYVARKKIFPPRPKAEEVTKLVTTPIDTGSVNINSRPASAEVYLDKDLKGTTPTGKIIVPAGTYQLKLTLSGYQEVSEEITVSKGRAFAHTYDLERTTPPAETNYSVEITSNPRDADVYIDGAYKTKTPGIITLTKSTGELRIEKARYETVTRSLDLSPGSNPPIHVDLKKPSVLFSVQTNPQRASVTLNDTSYGETPINGVPVPAGTYRIKLTLAGYQEVNEDITISTGQPWDKAYNLKRTPPPAEQAYSVEITSNPTNADVYLDGVYKIKTPGPVTLKKSTGELRIEIPGYETKTLSLDLNPGSNPAINVVLEKQSGLFSLRTNPRGASVTLDDKEYGPTPINGVRVPVGTYQLKLTLSGYDEVSEKITVSAGRPFDKAYPLKRTPPPAEQTYSVKITSTPPNADVYLDGVRKIKTPMIVTLKKSTGELRIQMANYETETLSLNLNPGSNPPINVDLKKASVLFSLQTNPRGASVTLNDTPYGPTPINGVPVSAGPYRLKLTLAGYQEVSEEITVGAGQPWDKAYNLKRLPPPAEQTYSVKITSTPPNADVYLDGVRKTNTPVTVTLKKSTGELRIQMANYETKTLSLNLNPGSNPPINVDLEKPSVLFSVQTNPQGASVTLNDTPYGPTPINGVRVPPGTYRLKLTLAGYQEVSEDITVSTGQPWEKAYDLKLIPRALSPAGPALVTFQTNDAGAEILLDGQIIKNESEVRPVKKSVDEGEHVVEFRWQKSGINFSKQVTCLSNRTYRVVGNMQKKEINMFDTTK